jgi:hypothetical protein
LVTGTDVGTFTRVSTGAGVVDRRLRPTNEVRANGLAEAVPVWSRTIGVAVAALRLARAADAKARLRIEVVTSKRRAVGHRGRVAAWAVVARAAAAGRGKRVVAGVDGAFAAIIADEASRRVCLTGSETRADHVDCLGLVAVDVAVGGHRFAGNDGPRGNRNVGSAGISVVISENASDEESTVTGSERARRRVADAAEDVAGEHAVRFGLVGAAAVHDRTRGANTRHTNSWDILIRRRKTAITVAGVSRGRVTSIALVG